MIKLHVHQWILLTAALGLSVAGLHAQTPPMNSDCLEFVGYLELAKDKAIVVTYYPPVSETQRIGPRERVYSKYFVMLDKSHPEERKYLVKLDGSVTMREDRSLRVAWEHSRKGEQGRPRTEILALGANGYEALLNRVHGLEPGETKGIPTRAQKCAAGRGSGDD